VPDSSGLLGVLTALADPLRLALLQHLMGGAAAVSELVAVTGASQPNVSNHLNLLRKRGLVRAVRLGRQRLYELKDPRVAQLIESLGSVAGGKRTPTVKDTALVQARTCYDHLAGKLGVRLFEALVKRKAIHMIEQLPAGARAGSTHPLKLGPAAEPVFAEFGITLKDALKGKRSPVYACRDWTERRPHLGGGLGAALWARFVETGWVQRKPGTRAVLVTPKGRRALEERLGISFDP
jgi:DNA-binding transcriptional ArsR family regulator